MSYVMGVNVCILISIYVIFLYNGIIKQKHQRRYQFEFVVFDINVDDPLKR